jgi:hypothetical protein
MVCGVAIGGVLASETMPRAKWMAAAVAAGLVYMAVTNTCTVSPYVAKLSYNRTTPCDVDGILEALRPVSNGTVRPDPGRSPTPDLCLEMRRCEPISLLPTGRLSARANAAFAGRSSAASSCPLVQLAGHRSRASGCSRGRRPSGSGSGATGHPGGLPRQRLGVVGGSLTRLRQRRARLL